MAAVGVLPEHHNAVIERSKIRDYALNFIHPSYRQRVPDPNHKGPKKKAPRVAITTVQASPQELAKSQEKLKDPQYRPEDEVHNGRIQPFEQIGYTLRRDHVLDKATDARLEVSADHLEAQLRQGLSRTANAAKPTGDSPTGPRHEVSMIITGPNGGRARLFTVWQNDLNEVTGAIKNNPRLITIWPLGVVSQDAVEGPKKK